jgi:cysteine synthase A
MEDDKEKQVMNATDAGLPNSYRSISPSMLRAIGSTPLVQLHKIPLANSADILVKLEYYNPTGSYKDRMALSMIEEAEARGDLRRGMRVVEYTGGSTGSSLAFVCAVKGYKLDIVTSDAFAREKLQTMRAFGANLTIVPSLNGQITPDLTPRMIEKARELANQPDTYFTNQLYNPDVVKGYEPLGEELLAQVNGPIHAFCGGVGTAGMLMGVSRVLRRAGSTAKVVALEPAASPILSKGTSGTHEVEGIGIGMVPPLLDRNYYEEARGIDEDEAREMAHRLAREEGIFAGTSTGLNVVAAQQLARQLGPGHTVVTAAVDTGLKYLAGNLFAE